MRDLNQRSPNLYILYFSRTTRTHFAIVFNNIRYKLRHPDEEKDTQYNVI